MAQWKKNAYYLATILLVAGLLFASQLTQEYYKAGFNTSFDRGYFQSFYLSKIGGGLLIGLLLGTESIWGQRKIAGSWKFNYSKVLFVGLPALLCSSWIILSIHDSFFLPALQPFLTNQEAILALVAGWALGGSFYKETQKSVPLQVGCPDDQ
ncbi:MAG TPA: hypothetical protein VN426_15945 [Syntrophomonadaceae bacterium]|nr:hypothetical protein [Syntrophomonadaceae bacterium]